MKEGPKEGRNKPKDKFEGLDDEQREALQDLHAKILGREDTPKNRKIADDMVEYQRLSMLLTDELERLTKTGWSLYEQICRAVDEDMPIIDPKSLTVEHLSTSEDSDARVRVINAIRAEPAAQKIVQILNELDKFLLSIPQ